MPNCIRGSCGGRRRTTLPSRPSGRSGRSVPRRGAGPFAGPAAGLFAGLFAGLAALAGLATWTVLGTRSRRFSAADVPTTEWGLVLGAEMYPSGDPSPSLRARLDLGLELFRAGKVRRLIVSGDESSNAQVNQMARYLLERGVPADRVVLDRHGVDTYASCRFARALPGLEAVTMISQDYHLPRALTLCRSIGLEAYGVGDTGLHHRSPRAWRWSVRREIAANVKMLFDLARHHHRGA